MKNSILSNLTNPKELESLYRSNKSLFKQEFSKLYPEIKENAIAETWNERLNYSEPLIDWGGKRELLFVITASLLAFAVAKIPEFTGISEDFFYSRNIPFIFMPFLVLYFILKEKARTKNILIIAFLLLGSCIYINVLPNGENSDSIALACIFMPFVIWSILGFSFVGNDYKSDRKRLDFLSYNGDLVVMTILILIAGVLFTAITINLFRMIGVDAIDFYMQYIAIAGLVASPIVATYLVQQNPWLVNKVSPVIAKIFTPLVLVMLVIFLVFAVISKINPFLDRDFLLVFNLLLIGVIAIIFFSIAGRKNEKRSKPELITLFVLASLTAIVNIIVLSAILYRITEWGFTPNRLAVLGSNVIVLIHLLLVTYRLFKTIRNNTEISYVENAIARYLPVYTVWTMVIVFVFPLIYQ